MPATLKDVAHATGISNVTASRVLTGKQSGAVAVLVEDITDPFFATLIPEVDRVLKERNYHLLDNRASAHRRARAHRDDVAAGPHYCGRRGTTGRPAGPAGPAARARVDRPAVHGTRAEL